MVNLASGEQTLRQVRGMVTQKRIYMKGWSAIEAVYAVLCVDVVGGTKDCDQESASVKQVESWNGRWQGVWGRHGRLGFQQMLQFTTATQLHDHVKVIFPSKDLKDLDDVGVVELLHQLDFSE